MSDPCDVCLVKAMCKKPCDNFISYLTTHIKKPHGNGINHAYLAELIRKKVVKLDLEYSEQWWWLE